MSAIFEQIQQLLHKHRIAFRSCEHEPTRTSEASAAARGESLGTGAKALLLKTNDEFRLFVMPANRKLDSKAIKSELGTKRIRFATAEELLEMTRLVPGSVPPFGKPILPFELYIDSELQNNQKIAFNAGSLTRSIIMQANDYFELVEATIFPFTKPS